MARWYADDPLPSGREAVLDLGDPRDYEQEDCVIVAWRTHCDEFANEIAVIPRNEVGWHHPDRK